MEEKKAAVLNFKNLVNDFDFHPSRHVVYAGDVDGCLHRYCNQCYLDDIECTLPTTAHCFVSVVHCRRAYSPVVTSAPAAAPVRMHNSSIRTICVTDAGQRVIRLANVLCCGIQKRNACRSESCRSK